jgi:hypothetical protein
MIKQNPLLLDAFLPGISFPFVGEGGGGLEKFGSPPSFLLSHRGRGIFFRYSK